MFFFPEIAACSKFPGGGGIWRFPGSPLPETCLAETLAIARSNDARYNALTFMYM